MSHPLLYGFDLCTDTMTSLIDPARHRITKVGLSTSSGEEVYDGEEGEILHLVDHRLAALPPGILVSWQGSILDFPLFVERARRVGLECGLRLRPDHRPAPDSVLAGLPHPWCSDWYSHRHLELRRVYDASNRWWNPMRSKLDPESMIPPADDLARRNPARDARLARVLAERRWHQAKKFIDRMPERASWTPPSADDWGDDQQQRASNS